MSGCLAENTLVEFVEGHLSASATGELHRHVDGCLRCRVLLKEIAGTFFRDLSPAEPPRPSTELRASLDETPPSWSLRVADPSSGASAEAAPERAGPPRPREVALHAGDVVGQYRIVRRIGIGGMGAVFEAAHEQIGRRVAVKVLYPQYSENPHMVARFFNEARAANIVRHPAIVACFEVGHLPGGEAYMVMEYLDGESLGARLKRLGGRLGRDTLRVMRQIASALVAAHGWGVIHRDLKPGNVMLVRDPEMAGGERVKLLDFGLAKVGAELHQEGEEEYSTHAGAILGTPAYMAPEQCQEASTVDEKADVYSLGVMLYECLAGRLPFVAKGAVDLMAMHIHVPPPPLSEVAPEVPPRLQELVHAMLAKCPAERPAMSDVERALAQLDTDGTTGKHLAIRLPPQEVAARNRRVFLRAQPVLLSGLGLLMAAVLGLWIWPLFRAADAPPQQVAASPPAAPAAPAGIAQAPAVFDAGSPTSSHPLSQGYPTAPHLAEARREPAAVKGPARRAPRPAAKAPEKKPPRAEPAKDWTDEQIRIFQ